MSKFPIEKVLTILEQESKKWNSPVFTLIKLQKKDPFLILITTIISLRTRDEITIEITKKLYKKLSKPKDILNLNISKLEKLIYPTGFYKRKAIQIHTICKSLIKNYNSIVPNDINTLLTFPGIGRKTANLILAEGYSIPAMCVDVHVNRISNRFGFIRTKTAFETEMRLRIKLNKKYWNKYNQLLVALGQSICKPITPKCSICPINKYCKKIKVKNKN